MEHHVLHRDRIPEHVDDLGAHADDVSVDLRRGGETDSSGDLTGGHCDR